MATQKVADQNGEKPMDKAQNSTNTNQPTSTKQYDELMEEADKERTRKPGSQSNSSGMDNNGRGGGK